MLKNALCFLLLLSGPLAFADQQPEPVPVEKVEFKTLAGIVRCAGDCTTKTSQVHSIEMEMAMSKTENGGVFYTASFPFGISSDEYTFRTKIYFVKTLTGKGWIYTVDVITQAVDKNGRIETSSLGTIYLDDINNLNTMSLYSPIKNIGGIELMPYVLIGSKNANLDEIRAFQFKNQKF